MTTYRFYAEMPDARRSKSGSKEWRPFTRLSLSNDAQYGYHNNCIAVPLDDRGQPLWQGRTEMMDGFAGISGVSNAPVCSTSQSREYLRKRCVRINEGLARRLHPRLFEYLE